MNDTTHAIDSNSAFIIHPSALAPGLPVPAPKVPINIRVATMADLPFMDGLQKKHSKQLGYFPTKQFEGYIAMGGVLVAEARAEDSGLRTELKADPLSPQSSALSPVSLGYVISRDRYLKRDELGVIYQLCVRPDVQRGLIGAALIQAVFERAAYGCRLFCCWCAQDLGANRFWEAMGFVPIAFRGGSDKKKRVHIFWQKRIRRGDTTSPWWFPSKTESGALRADRLVLPIPRGMRWDDEMPVMVGDAPVGHAIACRREKKRHAIACPTPKPARTPVQFGRPGAVMPSAEKPPAPCPEQNRGVPAVPATTIQRAKPKTLKAKCDPKLVQMARELRDRWLEQVNDEPGMLESNAKYEVGKVIEGRPSPAAAPLPATACCPPVTYTGEGKSRLLPAA